MHEFHPDLPGFDGRQVWHDGCEECEDRGADPIRGMTLLDPERFDAAWRRAADWERDKDVGRVSDAERPLLRLLWTFQVMLQRHAGVEPGTLPGR